MTGQRFTVALAQTNPVLGDVAANFDHAREQIAEARAAGADVVIFPELSLTGYLLGDRTAELAMPATDPRLGELARAAGDTDVVVGFVESSEDGTFNSAAYLSNGAVWHVHRKIFLPVYSSFNESRHFRPGSALRSFDTRFGRMGLPVCNDAWHPETTFLIVQDGACVLIVPACSARSHEPEVRGDYTRDWEWLCRFHARFLQCYVIFVNRVGREGARDFWGGSMVVGPDGELVAQAPRQQEALTIAQINLERVHAARDALPLLLEADFDLIASEVSRLRRGQGGQT